MPHVELVITGTGASAFVAEWANLVNLGAIVADIDQLDAEAPEQLRKLAPVAERPELAGTTIYHFGYSLSDGRYAGFAYRFENNWASEKLSDGFQMQPAVDVGEVVEPENIQFLTKLANQQRMSDLKLPLNKRTGIGGEVHWIVMSARAIMVSQLHRFEGYEREFDLMLSKRLGS